MSFSSPPATPPPNATPAAAREHAHPVARILAWAALGWSIYALMVTAVLYFYLPVSNQGTATWAGLVRWAAAPTLLWVLFTPAIVGLSRRFRVVGFRSVGPITVHVVAALVAHLATALFVYAIYPWIRGEARPLLQAVLLQSSLLDLLRYAILAIGIHAADYHRLYRDRHEEALRLRSELASAQLQVLKMQLQPHFLFNTLHAISELVYRDPRLADRALSRLADLLRMILASADRQEVSLTEEMAFLETYLDIERIRSGDALEVNLDIATDTTCLLVPSLLLQPLAENSLRHGVRGHPTGTLWITARRHGERLRIDVEDDGRGLPGGVLREGLGLRATRVRMHALYGATHEVTIGARPEGGTAVHLSLPAREGVSSVPANPFGAPA